jgi:broad specificity phosphatase PhoE
VGNRITGRQSGWHLNAAGREQAAGLAQKLSRVQIRAVYTSPLERAVETAAPIAESHSLRPRPLDALQEVHFGEWEGMSLDDLEQDPEWRRFNTYRSSVRAPGGELMLETQARMVAQLGCLRKHHPNDTVAIVSHADPLRSVIAYYLGISLDLLLRFEIGLASVSVLETDDWNSRVLCLNQTGAFTL